MSPHSEGWLMLQEKWKESEVEGFSILAKFMHEILATNASSSIRYQFSGAFVVGTMLNPDEEKQSIDYIETEVMMYQWHTPGSAILDNNSKAIMADALNLGNFPNKAKEKKDMNGIFINVNTHFHDVETIRDVTINFKEPSDGIYQFNRGKPEKCFVCNPSVFSEENGHIDPSKIEELSSTSMHLKQIINDVIDQASFTTKNVVFLNHEIFS